jgi:molybdopterin synthase catalytic subunit
MSEPVRLQLEEFSLTEEIRALRTVSRRIGGIATFIGCARDFSGGREVKAIVFDAHPAMALSELRKLRSEAIECFGLIDARLVHRLGDLRPGDDIVFIAAAAEHRAPALEACRWLIDRLKERVPIWKKEITSAGGSWVTPLP